MGLVLLLLGGAAAAEEGTGGARLGGSYAYVGGEGEIKKMYDAIDVVVGKMNVFIRGIARRRIRKPNMPPPVIELRIGQDNITLARSGHSDMPAPRDGKPAPWRSHEGKFRVSYALDASELVQKLVGQSSHVTKRFMLDPDGTTLRVQTRIESSRLPGPIEFTLTYRRK
ncbi:MAG: hypothetical protein ABI321_03460 [Polyangia bacterium]